MKKTFQYILLGALIGLSTSYIIITITLLLNPARVMNGSDLLLGCILAISLGVGCGLMSLIFYLDRWPYGVKLGIHYIVILALVLICGNIGDWYENPVDQPISFVLFIVFQFSIYVVIFAVVYWMDLRDIASINKKLKRRKI
ncbi:hypothetical protein HNO89_000347 [Sporosarcina luteola]|nr:hypothetical protein [Sporosarcina luteola]